MTMGTTAETGRTAGARRIVRKDGAGQKRRRPRLPSVLEVMADRLLFGRWFTPTESWHAWRVLLAALFGLPLTEAQMDVFRRHTGRQRAPATPVREAWLIVGRRGGKSLIAALVAVFLACFRDHRAVLKPGERGTIMVLAADRQQARVVLRYIAAMMTGVPLLASLIARQTREALHLRNEITIEVHTASPRSVRGYTIVGVICDEIAFWGRGGSTNPATEILAALRPGMATIPGALVLCLSSPHARQGALWDVYQAHYGRDDDSVLVWRADTRSMNPTIAPGVIADAYARDEVAATAEYGAEFRRDIEAFVPREVVEARVARGLTARPPAPGVTYFAFVDLADGVRNSSVLAIAHQAGDRGVLDAIHERRSPHNPADVLEAFAAVSKQYRCRSVTGDRQGGKWPAEYFRAHSIEYRVVDRSKSELYRDLLPRLTAGRVELLDHPRLIAQLCGLERRTAAGGRETIDHGPHGQDDVINAAAGALVLAARRSGLQIYATPANPSAGEVEWEGGEEWRNPKDPLKDTRRPVRRAREDDFTWHRYHLGW